LTNMALMVSILLLLPLIQSGFGLKVLFIGNSYTYYNDLPTMVAKVAKADGVDLEYDSHTEGGWTWEQHSNSPETINKIYSQAWDVVVLQEFSTRPAYDENFVCQNTMPYLNLLVEHIIANNPNTVIQFYLTWGRPHGESDLCQTQAQFCSYETMQAALTSSYITFACMNKPAQVAPVGESFKFVKDTHGLETFLSLYNTHGVSDHHPSLEGSYLAALAHYLALTGREVLGNSETFDLPSHTVEILQTAAQQVWLLRDWEFNSQEQCDLCMCDEC